MSRAVRSPHPEPMSEMNVTPFIDVLLVLLVMLILTIPIATHKVSVDLPNGSPPVQRDETAHKLMLDASGTVHWDGRAVRDSELPALLAPMAKSEVAVLHFQTDPETRYERFDQVLALVKRGGVTRLGFVGNQPLAD
ncbi:biopolymer transporter ExbD [Sphingomonas sp. HF-S3]|uniref:Biopolymer transporter ExbD n=1 Tax=Sphingomonas rustica TaxID=3103142 RepID=A0ABV0B1T3_9SPHN